MLITIIHGDKVFPLEIADDCTLDVLQALVQMETSVPPELQDLDLNGRKISRFSPASTVSQLGIGHESVIQVQRLSQPRARDSGELRLADVPPHLLEQPAQLQQFIRIHPSIMREIFDTNPMFAEAVLSDDPSVLEGILQGESRAASGGPSVSRDDLHTLSPAHVVSSLSFLSTTEQRDRAMQRRLAEQRRLAAIEADPMNPEHQALIEERIRAENIRRNYEAAMENNPESFVRVSMLYIPLQINRIPLKAFVDSGAQQTISEPL